MRRAILVGLILCGLGSKGVDAICTFFGSPPPRSNLMFSTTTALIFARVSGSCPRLPIRMTLLTPRAMGVPLSVNVVPEGWPL